MDDHISTLISSFSSLVSRRLLPISWSCRANTNVSVLGFQDLEFSLTLSVPRWLVCKPLPRLLPHLLPYILPHLLPRLSLTTIILISPRVTHCSSPSHDIGPRKLLDDELRASVSRFASEKIATQAIAPPTSRGYKHILSKWKE
jgi:hypothetical protein